MNIISYSYDDDLIEAARNEKRAKMRIYRLAETAVVIGRGGKPELELEADNIIKDGVRIFRRQGGGCAVVIDPGNIVLSVVLPVKGFTKNRHYFNLITEWLAKGLQEVRFSKVEKAGISDLAIEGRKIAGSCIYNGLDFLYFSTTLLVLSSIEYMEKYLKHPPREPEYRRGRKHSDFVANLADYRKDVEIESLRSELQQVLRAEDLAAEL